MSDRVYFYCDKDRSTHYFYFEQVDETESITETYALRFQVYCKERGFLAASDYPSGHETDEYEPRSSHFAGFHKGGVIAGTVRLIEGPLDRLPLAAKCSFNESALPPDISSARVAEISRLAVSKTFRRRMVDGILPAMREGQELELTDSASRRRNCPELVLGLYKAIYHFSKKSDIEYWFAAMEGSLAKLLNRFFFEFRPVGPEIDYYGPVRPYIASLTGLENKVYEHAPDLFWRFMQGLDDTYMPAIALDSQGTFQHRQRNDEPTK